MQNGKKQTKPKIEKLTEPTYNRQENETDKAWQAFCIYRDLPDGERTLTNVGRKLGVSRQNIDRLKAKWNWSKRLTDWQNEQILNEMDSLRAQHAKSIKDNITLAGAFKSEILKYIKWFKDNKQDMMAGMNPKDVVWIFQSMTNLERQMYEDILSKEDGGGKDTREQIIFTFER